MKVEKRNLVLVTFVIYPTFAGFNLLVCNTEYQRLIFPR